jgi:hypothetical protein
MFPQLSHENLRKAGKVSTPVAAGGKPDARWRV